MLKETKRMC